MLEHVTSDDGTPIAFTRLGSGPPLVIVHGGVNQGADWRRVADLLSADFCCFVMDRRGRGGSGDSLHYALAREAEDVAAVVRAAGSEAVLFGHSYGAVCALEAALISRVAQLIVYEPPLIDKNGHSVAAAFQAHLDTGRPDLALRGFLRETTGMPDSALSLLEASAAWQRMLDVAPTFPREANALYAELGKPARYRALRMPVLALVGEVTTPQLHAATTLLQFIIPQLRVQPLAGQGHAAHRTSPQLIATMIKESSTARPLRAISRCKWR